MLDSTVLDGGVLSSNVPLKANGKCNFPQMPETITKDWITNHPKYRHLFQGIGHFNCKPVAIELQSGAEPVRKAPQKVPLALKDKFSAEIQSMVQQGILSEVTQSMETLEWLNSFVIVKKPNGNLLVCLDPTDLNKHVIRPVCNMYTLEDIIDLKMPLTLPFLTQLSHFSMCPWMKPARN